MDILLIPGLWLDGASWDAVVPALHEAGHRTHPLTLPGMESPDADRSGITLRDHVDAVVRVIDSLDPADGGIVLPDWSTFDDEDLVDLDDDLRTAFRARALPSSEQVAAGRQKLSDERRYDVPVTVIACAWPSATIQNWLSEGEPSLAELSRVREVSWVDLPTGHWPQFTRPAELGQAILGAL